MVIKDTSDEDTKKAKESSSEEEDSSEEESSEEESEDEEKEKKVWLACASQLPSFNAFFLHLVPACSILFHVTLSCSIYLTSEPVGVAE